LEISRSTTEIAQNHSGDVSYAYADNAPTFPAKGAKVCINIGDGRNGKIATHSDVIQFMTRTGYLPFATIIWHKVQIGNRFAWGSWRSPLSPSFPEPFEYILIFAKESYSLQTKGAMGLKKKEFTKWSLAIWDIGPETQMEKIGHPAMFPVELH
jgi:DNA modification methylase